MTNTEQNKIIEQEREAENFIQKLRLVSLTKTEAHDMRERLIAYTDMHAVNASNKAAAPMALRGPAYFLSPLTSYFSSYPRAMVATTLILIILVSGTGVSFAAENSLPGQPFYAVKVSVVEPIQGALITSPTDKAKWQNELASRRLTEASTLAAQNNLGTTTQEYLAQSVADHVALAQQDASQLSASGNNDAALGVQSDLEAKLTAHANFLSLVTPRLKATGDATSTVIAVSSMLRVVNLQESKVQTSREATEIALGVTPSVSSTPDSASTTPAEAQVIAFVDSQDTARHAEEAKIFNKSASLFRFLPSADTLESSTSASTTASTTATTTADTNTSSNEPDQIKKGSDTETSSEPQKFPLYNLNFGR